MTRDAALPEVGASASIGGGAPHRHRLERGLSNGPKWENSQCAELRGKTVGLQSSGPALLSLIAAEVGLDPTKDIRWVSDPPLKPLDLFAAGKIDGFLGFPPEPQELRARGIGHVVVNTGVDRPWSQIFLLHAGGSPRLCPTKPGRDKACHSRHSKGRRDPRNRPRARRPAYGR